MLNIRTPSYQVCVQNVKKTYQIKTSSAQCEISQKKLISCQCNLNFKDQQPLPNPFQNRNLNWRILHLKLEKNPPKTNNSFFQTLQQFLYTVTIKNQQIDIMSSDDLYSWTKISLTSSFSSLCYSWKKIYKTTSEAASIWSRVAKTPHISRANLWVTASKTEVNRSSNSTQIFEDWRGEWRHKKVLSTDW